MASSKDFLKTYQQMLEERGFSTKAESVKTEIDTITSKEKIKQFYCRHTFNRFFTTIFGVPSRLRICSKCNIVK